MWETVQSHIREGLEFSRADYSGLKNAIKNASTKYGVNIKPAWQETRVTDNGGNGRANERTGLPDHLNILLQLNCLRTRIKKWVVYLSHHP